MPHFYGLPLLIPVLLIISDGKLHVSFAVAIFCYAVFIWKSNKFLRKCSFKTAFGISDIVVTQKSNVEHMRSLLLSTIKRKI